MSVKDNEVIALTATGFQESHTTASHANYTEYFTIFDKESEEVLMIVVTKAAPDED